MIRFSLALVVAGCFLAFFGYNEYKLASSADAEPQTMTAAELIANGPGDNAHVIVTDFACLIPETLMLTPEDDPDHYDKVWSPIITLDDPYLEELQSMDLNATTFPSYNEPVGLILYSKEISNDAQLMSVAEGESVQGLIINEIDKLGGDELKEFQKHINVDPDTVLVLEYNRKPKSAGVTLLIMAGGVLLILSGPGLFFIGRRKKEPEAAE